ncbi:hypothetical protein [Phenylobacterium sp.]|uniref:hypothetical protein n=1 Tax=Phenylobacterium sp. TaxID=1871053 RepID=UPI00272544A1|nr:hypothetical protein [Phenylobacterium sp.]MDO8802118.1 hypothetical protein [Phenylobacterium sp.]
MSPKVWEGLAQARANPQFQPAIELEARLARDAYHALPEGHRWLLGDRGRFNMGLIALLLAGSDALTAQNLSQISKTRDIGSSGRARKYVEHLLRHGLVSAESGDGRWTTHRLTLGPILLGHYRARLRATLEGMRLFDPSVTPALALTETDEFLPLCLTLAAANGDNSELAHQIYADGLGIFLERDCGMLILMDLMLAQPADRSRLLERAPLSRYGLARDYGVSRAHINKMLSDAAAAGLLSLEDDGGTVLFSHRLSELLELHSAAIFLGLRTGIGQYMASRPAARD